MHWWLSSFRRVSVYMARLSIWQQLWYIFYRPGVFCDLVFEQIVIVLPHLLASLFQLGSLHWLWVEAITHRGESWLIIIRHATEVWVRIVLACHAIYEAWRRAVPMIAPSTVANWVSLSWLVAIRNVTASLIGEVLLVRLLLLLEMSLLLLTLFVNFVLQLDDLGQLELLPRSNVHLALLFFFSKFSLQD